MNKKTVLIEKTSSVWKKDIAISALLLFNFYDNYYCKFDKKLKFDICVNAWMRAWIHNWWKVAFI